MLESSRVGLWEGGCVKHYPRLWDYEYTGSNVYRERDQLRELSDDLIDYCGELLTKIEEEAK